MSELLCNVNKRLTKYTEEQRSRRVNPTITDDIPRQWVDIQYIDRASRPESYRVFNERVCVPTNSLNLMSEPAINMMYYLGVMVRRWHSTLIPSDRVCYRVGSVGISDYHTIEARNIIGGIITASLVGRCIYCNKDFSINYSRETYTPIGYEQTYRTITIGDVNAMSQHR